MKTKRNNKLKGDIEKLRRKVQLIEKLERNDGEKIKKAAEFSMKQQLQLYK